MKNFVQPGHVITFTGLSGGHLSGDFTVIGAAFGVSAYNVAEGAEGELACGGVYTFPKATGAVAEGALVYWDSTAKKMTGTASTNLKVGVAMKAALSADAGITVRLNDNFV